MGYGEGFKEGYQGWPVENRQATGPLADAGRYEGQRRREQEAQEARDRQWREQDAQRRQEAQRIQESNDRTAKEIADRTRHDHEQRQRWADESRRRNESTRSQTTSSGFSGGVAPRWSPGSAAGTTGWSSSSSDSEEPGVFASIGHGIWTLVKGVVVIAIILIGIAVFAASEKDTPPRADRHQPTELSQESSALPSQFPDSPPQPSPAGTAQDNATASEENDDEGTETEEAENENLGPDVAPPNLRANPARPASTPSPVGPSPAVRWHMVMMPLVLRDRCDDQAPIFVRFFDQTHGGAVWPPGAPVALLRPDQPMSVRLPCSEGATICMGAATSSAPDAFFWGAGLDNTNPPPASSCFRCVEGAPIDMPFECQ